MSSVALEPTNMIQYMWEIDGNGHNLPRLAAEIGLGRASLASASRLGQAYSSDVFKLGAQVVIYSTFLGHLGCHNHILRYVIYDILLLDCHWLTQARDLQ